MKVQVPKIMIFTHYPHVPFTCKCIHPEDFAFYAQKIKDMSTDKI
jgi:hypothetical protein